MGAEREKENEQMARLRQAALNAITETDVRDMMQNLMERTKRGHKEAVRMVLAYLTPPPEPAPKKQLNVLNLRESNGRAPRRVLEHKPEGEANA